MTIPEFAAYMDAHADQRRMSCEVATLAAWQTARLMRTDPKKRLPTLKKLFAEFDERPGTPQSLKQMAGVLRQLSAQYKYPLRQVAAHG